MTASDIKGILSVAWQIAKTAPSGATILVLVAGGIWLAYTHNFSHAKADEVKTVKEDVAAVKQDVAAVKDDVSDLQTEVKAGRVEALEGQLFAAKVEQCKAQGNEKELYAQRVSTLQARYRTLTSVSFSLPECAEL